MSGAGVKAGSVTLKVTLTRRDSAFASTSLDLAERLYEVSTAKTE